ncbi:MAG: hypothetical protein ABIB43_00260 [archaeon]
MINVDINSPQYEEMMKYVGAAIEDAYNGRPMNPEYQNNFFYKMQYNNVLRDNPTITIKKDVDSIDSKL